MSIGTYQREYPRGVIMRGWDPQNPTTFSISLPVARNPITMRPQLIWQGQIMTPNDAGTQWELGVSPTKAAAHPAVIAFAQNDSIDFDVVAADKLVGLSCSGKFRFGTPFFMRQKATGTIDAPVASGDPYMYKLGTRLTYATNDEIDITTTVVGGSTVQVGRSAAGFIRPAVQGEVVIGVVAESHSGVNGSADMNQTQNGAWALQTTIGAAVDSSSMVDNAYFVVWDTTFSPDATMA